MSKLLSSSIQDGAVNFTSLNNFRAMLNSSGPSCFADITIKVNNITFFISCIKIITCLYLFVVSRMKTKVNLRYLGVVKSKSKRRCEKNRFVFCFYVPSFLNCQ